MTTTHVRRFYQSVMDDVIQNVRETFLDEGADEQVLQELKQIWESKVMNSKAVDPYTPEQEQIISRLQHHSAPGPLTKKKNQSRPALQPFQQQQVLLATSTTPSFSVAPPPVLQGVPRMVARLPMFTTAPATAGLSQAAQAAASALPASFYQQQFALSGNSIIVQTPQGQFLATTAAPGTLTTPVTRPDGSKQLDGANDSSSEEDEENIDNDGDDDDVVEETEEHGEEGDPLNSEDDLSSEDPTDDVFDTDNVVVCQFEKIHRAKSRWRFQLKDGIMNVNGRDVVFQRGVGECEW